MIDKSKWMNADEAVEQIMRSKKCSRRAARRLMARAIENKELPVQKVVLPPLPTLDPDEVIEMMADDPASVVISLADVMRLGGFDVAEIMAELRSGRLRVFPLNESVMIRAELRSGPLPAAHFGVSGDKLLDWMVHPQTPPHIRDRIAGRKPPH
jgi:hypothetical protein